jgi:hypothetical protein
VDPCRIASFIRSLHLRALLKELTPDETAVAFRVSARLMDEGIAQPNLPNDIFAELALKYLLEEMVIREEAVATRRTMPHLPVEAIPPC